MTCVKSLKTLPHRRPPALPPPSLPSPTNAAPPPPPPLDVDAVPPSADSIDIQPPPLPAPDDSDGYDAEHIPPPPIPASFHITPPPPQPEHPVARHHKRVRRMSMPSLEELHETKLQHKRRHSAAELLGLDIDAVGHMLREMKLLVDQKHQDEKQKVRVSCNSVFVVNV